MKRIGDIYSRIYDLDNLREADRKAQKKKSKQNSVIRHNKNAEENLLNLHHMLKDKTYKTSQYKTFKVFDKKERDVFRLPYFPDRICHHAIMNILEPIFVSTFTTDTFSCIKGRGIHGGIRKVDGAMKDKGNTFFALKIDIRKFYPSVDHDILKKSFRRKFKDKDLLWLLDEIIDSVPSGIPIGNYISQYAANFYLSYFDHWIKEEKRVRYYFRYADDIVVFSSEKPYLHRLLSDMRKYLFEELKLDVKRNYQVFPVDARGLDFLGIISYHWKKRLRKSIKQACARAMKKNPSKETKGAYKGWLDSADCKHLARKLFKDERIQRIGDSPNRSTICRKEG